MARYKVNGAAEEFDCPECGAPVYNGETAYQDGAGGDCYCSAHCCIAHGERTGPEEYRKWITAARVRAAKLSGGTI